MVVALAGNLSDDCDLDADYGALLIFPQRLVSVEPLDAEVVELIPPADRGRGGRPRDLTTGVP